MHPAEERVRCMMVSTEALASVPLFSRFDEAKREEIARLAKVISYAPGHLLARQGEDAVTLHALLKGEAEVVRDLGLPSETILGRLHPGDHFGEMALLDGFPRSASVRAVSDCESAVLLRWDFTTLARNNVSMLEAMLIVLSQRLRDCEKAVVN